MMMMKSVTRKGSVFLLIFSLHDKTLLKLCRSDYIIVIRPLAFHIRSTIFESAKIEHNPMSPHAACPFRFTTVSLYVLILFFYLYNCRLQNLYILFRTIDFNIFHIYTYIFFFVSIFVVKNFCSVLNYL